MSTRKKQILLGIVAAFIGYLVIHFGVDTICTYSLTREKYAEAEDTLNQASARMQVLAEDTESEWEFIDSHLQSALNSAAWLMKRSAAFKDDLEDTASSWGFTYLYITDANGNILSTNNNDAQGRSLSELGLGAFTENQEPSDEGIFRVTTATGYYYIASLDDGTYLVGGKESPEMIEYQSERKQPSFALANMHLGEDGFIAAVRLSDGAIVYSRDEAVNGLAFDSVCNKKLPEAGYNNWLTIGGTKYYAWTKDVTADNTAYRLLGLISYKELYYSDFAAVMIAKSAYLIAALLILLYSHYLSNDLMNSSMATNIRYRKLNDKYYLNLTIFRKLVAVALISGVAIICVSWYSQALSSVSRQRITSDKKLSDYTAYLDESTADYNEVLKMYEYEYTEHRAKSIAWAIARDPSLINEDALTELARLCDISAINVYDGEGNMEATTTSYKDITLPTEEDNPYSAFWDIVKGYKDTLSVDAAGEDSSYYHLHEYIAAKRTDTESGGMVQIAVSDDRFSELMETSSALHIINSFEDETLMVLDSETGKVLYALDDKMIGKSATDYGMEESTVKDDYTGWQTINGIYCFLMSKAHDNMLLYIGSSTIEFIRKTFVVSAFTALITSGLLLLTVLLVSINEHSAIIATISTAKKSYKQRASYIVIDNKGRLTTTQSADTRWSGDNVPFREMNAGQKLSFITKTGIVIGFFILLCIYYKNIRNSESLLAFIASCRWDYSVNLFSISFALLYAVKISIISAVLRKIIKIVSRQFDSRVKTVGRMFESFIKYAAALTILYEALLHFGVDSKTLTTGTGLLTLVIGLGANNMISDIIAGIFIVFEGDYRVGDIVTIDKWRGTVQEIGIRTTKIISPGKDIKIIRNSYASGVVNMTRQYSIASVEFNVPANEDLTHMESHMDELLSDIKKSIPELMEGPVYSGVVAYAAGAATVRISAFCKEADRDEVTNKLNRELKLMFDKARSKAD